MSFLALQEEQGKGDGVHGLLRGQPVTVLLTGQRKLLHRELVTWFSGKPCTDLEEFRNYLEKRFDFEQVTVKKFRTWAERRQFNREMKRKQAESERPILPANQKLITLSVQDAPTKKGASGLGYFNIGRLVTL